VHVLLELLFVKFGHFSVSCFSQAVVAHVVDFICTFGSVKHAFDIVYFVYDFHNK